MKDYRQENHRFYSSRAWQQTREAYISKRVLIDGGCCERCRMKPGFIVHHKEHLDEAKAKDPSIALNQDNLEFLCKACHDDEHLGRRKPAAAVVFDKNGQPIPMDKR